MTKKTATLLESIATRWMNQKTFTSGNITVPANGTVEASIDVANTGYNPVGLDGILKGGAGNGYIAIAAWYFTNNTLRVSLVNNTGTSRTITLTAVIRYMYGGGTA
jgi:hypothetical protein